MDERPYLTVAQIAARLQVSEELIRRALRQGDLHGVRFGKSAGWRVSEAELAVWLASHAGGGRTVTAFEVGDLVWYKGDPPAIGAEGAISARQGRIEGLTGDEALVRWKVIDQSGVRWLPELEQVRKANLVKAKKDGEPAPTANRPEN